MKNKFSYSLLALVLFAQALAAETIYKGQDASGNPSFSDKPSPNSQKIEIDPIPTYTPAPLPAAQNPANQNMKNPQEVAAYEISIVQPKDEETFTTDIENVNINVSVSPSLQSSDKIRYLLNGKPYGDLSNQLAMSLGRLDRGSYLIKAEIVGADGKMKGESRTVIFYQNRTTILNKNHNPPPP